MKSPRIAILETFVLSSHKASPLKLHGVSMCVVPHFLFSMPISDLHCPPKIMGRIEKVAGPASRWPRSGMLSHIGSPQQNSRGRRTTCRRQLIPQTVLCSCVCSAELEHLTAARPIKLCAHQPSVFIQQELHVDFVPDPAQGIVHKTFQQC